METVEQIASQSKKPVEEIEKLVEEKKRKFSGLLTDSGAAYMVAKELGIELGSESLKRVSVSQLRDEMQNVDLLVRVMQVFSPKQFEKNGKKGKLCNLIVADSTGEIRLTVWHDDVKIISEKRVKRGSTLLLKNCYVKSFNGKPQLSLSYNGSIVAEPKDLSFEQLPEANSSFSKLSGLSENMNDVNVIGRILRVYPATEFEKEERKGRVVNFLLGDETSVVRGTAWNDLVEKVLENRENQVVSIEGAYTKPGLKGLELHLGWCARIEKSASKEIPEAPELLKAGSEKKKILELKNGDSNILLEGKIVLVNQGALFYNVCPGCGGKVQRLEEGIVCDKCGEVKEPGAKAVISVRVDDGSAQMDAVAYGKEAEKIIGLDNDSIKKQVGEKGREAMIGELQSLKGNKITLIGKVKENTYSNQLEFVANVVEFE